MLRLYECVTEAHDPAFVLAAGLLCLFGALVSINVVRRAVRNAGLVRAGWLAAAGLATGIGAWGAHFIAMLAYAPPVSIAFGPGLTGLSLAVAIIVCGLGWTAAVTGGVRAAHLCGGALVGLGVVAMHYIGMAALVVDARMVWDMGFVGVSAAIGAVAGALAARTLLAGRGAWRVYAATGLLALGVLGLHFTGMTGLELVPDPTLARPEALLSPLLMAGVVAASAAGLLALSLAGAAFDQHLSARRDRENGRLRDIVDASFEGLAIEANGRILNSNKRLRTLLGVSLKDLQGRGLDSFLARPGDREALRAAPEGEACACSIRAADGRMVSVEILSRAIDLGGRPGRILAVRDMTEREKAEARILHLAHHDALTGMANRARFNERLAEALADAGRTGGKAAVICLDLDRFKVVNDVHGHAAGDALLVQLARRLDAALPANATAARLGGDEFAVILPGAPERKTVLKLAAQLVERLSEVYYFDGVTLSVGASAGVAIYPAHGRDAETLAARADMALYRAKGAGGDGVRLFEPAMDAQMRERRRMEIDLRAALSEKSLELHYQPQASAQTGAVMGFEALARWNRAGHGAVEPQVFIALAEETGLILPLGEWVLNEACREAAGWPRPYRVAVNVSPAQFKQGNLVYTVQRALERSGLEPSRLELEITEGVLIEDETRARDMLQWLKALGVRIAMDDFGVGYSSLNYLRTFPFDKIKLDRSFITGLKDQREARAIVRATASLARDLGLSVVAEGVETAADLDALREERCLEVQGFLLSRPVTPGQLAPFFNEEPPYQAAFAVPAPRLALPYGGGAA